MSGALAPEPKGELTAFLGQALELANRNVTQEGGRPFGAVLTRGGKILATGVNRCVATGDLTAHAELEALRAAGIAGELQGEGDLVMYASGQPCPMCLAAMHLAGVKAAFYAYSNQEGEAYGLSSEPIYSELRKPLNEQRLRFVHEPVRLPGIDAYAAWRDLQAGMGD